MELQIFCRGQIRLKFVRPSACRTVADFLSRLTALRLGAESSKIKMAPIPLISASISTMLEKTLVHVTLMTFPNWLRRARALTNCLGPPLTSRQGSTRRFELNCHISPDKPLVAFFVGRQKNRLVCGGL